MTTVLLSTAANDPPASFFTQPLAVTSYGLLEFAFEDLDGRRIGVGLI